MIQRTGWTYEEVLETPDDLIDNLTDAWAAQDRARKIKETRPGG